MTSKQQLDLLAAIPLSLGSGGDTLRLRAAARIARSLGDLVMTAASGEETALKAPVWEELRRVYHGLREHAIRQSARRSVRRDLLSELLAFRESGIVPDEVLVSEAGTFLAREESGEPGLSTLRLRLLYVHYGLQAESLRGEPAGEALREWASDAAAKPSVDPDAGLGGRLCRAELMALLARFFPEDAAAVPGFTEALLQVHDALVPEALAALSPKMELADIEALYNLLTEEIRPEEDRRLLHGLTDTLDKQILPAHADSDARLFLRSLLLDAENREKRQGRWGKMRNN